MGTICSFNGNLVPIPIKSKVSTFFVIFSVEKKRIHKKYIYIIKMNIIP